MSRLLPGGDSEIGAVCDEIGRRVEPPLVRTFGQTIRQAIDEVLDGPRTGRYDFSQLEKTEKTYVGTKLEILIRQVLDVERGPRRDLELAGVAVDHKWAWNSQWMIPPESRDEIILCLGGLRRLTEFQVGVVRCTDEHVKWPRPGQPGQRDRKGTLSPAGRQTMRFLVRPAPLPQNFVALLDPEIRWSAMREPTIQRRVTRLFKALPYTPVPRSALQTIALTDGDPVRRSRQDRHAGDPLEGMHVLSNQDGGNVILEALGFDKLAPGWFMAIPRGDLQRVPAGVRENLSETARARFDL